jgi:hypothetical protein
MSRTESEIDAIRERHQAACDFPSVLDELEVEGNLAAFLQALGVSRQIVRLRAGWRLADHPPLERNIERILDEWAWLDLDALVVRVALGDGEALDAVPAGEALAARDAIADSLVIADDNLVAAFDVLPQAREAARAVATRDVVDAIAAGRVDTRGNFVFSFPVDSPAEAVHDARGRLESVGAGWAAFFTPQRFAAWCILTGSLDLSHEAVENVLGVQGAAAWTDRLFDAFVCGCWLVYWTDEVLYWAAKPTVHREPPNQEMDNFEPLPAVLHHDHHAAIESDIANLYFWHGVMVPAFVVVRPDRITVDHIDRESNAEVRRIMIERYRHGEDLHGAAAFLRDAGAERLDHDARYGTLWRRAMPGGEPITMVEVVNATSEPDGSRKRYWLRVPPDMTTARAAVAWTFGVTAEEYAPVKET